MSNKLQRQVGFDPTGGNVLKVNEIPAFAFAAKRFILRL
jgi:hypothetical protein